MNILSMHNELKTPSHLGICCSVQLTILGSLSLGWSNCYIMMQLFCSVLN